MLLGALALAIVMIESSSRIDREALVRFPRLFGASAVSGTDTDALEPSTHEWQEVRALSTGYITGVDRMGLLEWCGDERIVLRMEHAVGDHVVRGTPLVSVAASRSIDGDAIRTLNGMFGIAPNRTVEDDPVFGFRQMVDIAVKALSPGVNDTTTAIASIDAIGAALHFLAGRADPARHVVRGTAVLIVRRPTVEDIVAVGVDEIRRSAESNVNVLKRLLGMLATVATGTNDDHRRAVLRAQAERILAAAERGVADPVDRESIAATFR